MVSYRKHILILGVVALLSAPRGYSLAPSQWHELPKVSATPAIVQTPKPVSSVAASQWTRFNQSQGNNWNIEWSPNTGFPAQIAGGRYKVTKDTPRNMAKQFLKDNHQLLGMKGDFTDITDKTSHEGLTGYHLRFAQSISGIEVYNSQISVHVSKDGEIFWVNSNFDPSIVLSNTQPVLSSDSAQSIALQYLNIKTLIEQPSSQLMVYPNNNINKLVWVVTIVGEDPIGGWKVLVDANNGTILHLEDITRSGNLTGTGKVFIPNPVVSTQNNKLRDGNNVDTAVYPASSYTTVTLYGLDSASTNGLYYLRGSYVNCQNIEKPNTNPPGVSSTSQFTWTRASTQFEWVMVYYHIDQIQRYIQTLGFSSVNNRQIKVDAHGLNGADNSYYVSNPVGAGYLVFGDGGVDDAEDAEVIAHEYGHSIQDNQVPGFGGTEEGGAMGEGFGDWLAATYFFAYSNGFQNECIMDWDATYYSSDTPPCLRRLDSTKHYPTDIDGEVHDDGEMWSASLWSIFNTLGKNSTNRDIMMKLVLESHFFLTSNANFINGANAIIQADNLLFSGTHTSVISTAFINRGIFTAVPVEISEFSAQSYTLPHQYIPPEYTEPKPVINRP